MAESSVETNATPTTRPQARRLKGHKAIATCCIASRDRPGLIASSSEVRTLSHLLICLFQLCYHFTVCLLTLANHLIPKERRTLH